MQYNVNPYFTNTTSEELDVYLKSFMDDGSPTPVQIENTLSLNLEDTFKNLEKVFSKMYYEVISEETRNNILEYCLTLYSGQMRNVFCVFTPMNLNIQSRQLALRYFTYHVIIYIAEKTNNTPIQVIGQIKSLFDNPNLKSFIQGYTTPLQSFSNLDNATQVKVKIDECLLKIKYNGISEPNLSTLLIFLLVLNTCNSENFL